MSQRREEVRDVNENDGDTKMEYTYIAPTGFISGEEIIDDDFRKMLTENNDKKDIRKLSMLVRKLKNEL